MNAPSLSIIIQMSQISLHVQHIPQTQLSNRNGTINTASYQYHICNHHIHTQQLAVHVVQISPTYNITNLHAMHN